VQACQLVSFDPDALSYYYDHREEVEEEISLIQNELLWQKKYPSGKGVARAVNIRNKGGRINEEYYS